MMELTAMFPGDTEPMADDVRADLKWAEATAAKTQVN
jgi:hypothetical protein